MKATRRLLTAMVLALALCLFCSAFVSANGGEVSTAQQITQATEVTIKSSVTNILDAGGNYSNCWFADIEAKGSNLVLYKLMDGDTVLQSGLCKLDGTDGTVFFGCMKFEINEAAGKSYKIVISSIDERVAAEARTFRILCKVSSERSVPYMNGVVASDGYTYNTEPTFFDTEEGKDYNIKAGAASSVNINYSDAASQYVVEYEPFIDDITMSATLTYSDLDGNILGTDSFPINETGTTAITVPETVVKDENSYEKISGQANTVLVSRTSAKTDYTFYYLPTDSNGRYTARVRFVLAGTDIELMPTKSISVKGVSVSYIAPSVISIKDSVTGNTVSYRTTLQKSQLTFEPDSPVRNYTVEYSTLDEASYSWFVRRIDASTGATIGQDTAINVNPGETKELTLENSFEYNGINYTLDSAMGDKLTYTFGDANRISYVYYNPEGYDREQSYEITIHCYSITDSSFFYDYKVKTTPEQLTTVDVPDTYNINGNTFVLLNGQQTSFTHNYYSPERNYTIFYRDINDIQNEVTRVTTVDIISDIFEDGGYIFTDYSQNIVYNEDSGENTVIEDIDIPLSDVQDTQPSETSGALKEIKDNRIPLAASSESLPIGKIIVICASGLVFIIVAVILIAAIRKRNNRRARRAK